ncbi:MAG: TonB C-terminal domain-containing protein [Terriglobales bacterium]
MPVTQIPSRDPLSPPAESPEQRDLFEAQHWETAYRSFNPDDVPHLLIQLQDDLSRARKREALWLSVILHLFVVILLWNSEKLMTLWPHRPVELAIRTNADQSKDATFLELPPDEQKLTRRPDAKVLSDKDRIATSKSPQINRDELRKLLQSEHPGQPGGNTPQPPAQGQPPQNQAAPTQAPPAPPDNSQGFSVPQPSDQTARLQTPPQSKPAPSFKTPMTAGSAIEQAERAAAANRGYAGSGQLGDGGLTRGRNQPALGMAPAEILTDTMGVDFGPYITRILQVIRQNWIGLLPPSAYPPIWKSGKDSIDFTILKDGKVSGMVWHSGSGDVAVDRAAWGSIIESNPLPPLPREFPGPNLGLRLNFYLNMNIDDVK